MESINPISIKTAALTSLSFSESIRVIIDLSFSWASLCIFKNLVIVPPSQKGETSEGVGLSGMPSQIPRSGRMEGCSRDFQAIISRRMDYVSQIMGRTFRSQTLPFSHAVGFSELVQQPVVCGEPTPRLLAKKPFLLKSIVLEHLSFENFSKCPSGKELVSS